jgi:hypothetical protein
MDNINNSIYNIPTQHKANGGVFKHPHRLGVFENRVLRRIFGGICLAVFFICTWLHFARFHLYFSVLFSLLILLFLACVREGKQTTTPARNNKINEENHKWKRAKCNHMQEKAKK